MLIISGGGVVPVVVVVVVVVVVADDVVFWTKDSLSHTLWNDTKEWHIYTLQLLSTCI